MEFTEPVYSRFRFRQQILFVKFMFVQMVSDLHIQRFFGTYSPSTTWEDIPLQCIARPFMIVLTALTMVTNVSVDIVTCFFGKDVIHQSRSFDSDSIRFLSVKMQKYLESIDFSHKHRRFTCWMVHQSQFYCWAGNLSGLLLTVPWMWPEKTCHHHR